MVAMTTETVQQAAIDTLNTRQDVDGTLSGLKSLCDMLASAWTGSGATAFQAVMADWDKEAQDLLDALENIANMLDASAVATDDQDSESASDFGGLL
ncbi:WXG100 family type VII secretion target [Glycomyces artemisiae]|uniref:ESAT-6-like protein n=2 Tax=Glycomyces artemisiae TaxID=1076443 RepID=A0A2T0U8A9_9ACTN|nr:WXG100 family type VII secretion target [Glycomyces artemisiae]